MNISHSLLLPMLMNILFKQTKFPDLEKIYEKACGDLKTKKKLSWGTGKMPYVLVAAVKPMERAVGTTIKQV